MISAETDLVVIGGGASAYGFLKGLGGNNHFKNTKVILIYPSEYNARTELINIADISPKFLQKKNLLSLSYYLHSFGNYIEKGFTHIGVHGIGGMARIWGGSIGVFDKKSLIKNNFNPSEFQSIYDEIDSFLPSGCNSIKVSKKIKKLFGNYVNSRLKISFPKLLIKDNCNNCNQCLAGCDLNSIWYPTKDDFENIENLDINIMENCFVTNISDNKLTYKNKYNENKYLNSNTIVLAAGTMQNYKLMINLKECKSTKAKLYTTPALAFAFLNFTRNSEKKFFGMGNATFLIEKNKNIQFYGNLYDGYSLSISKGKVFSKYRVIDSIYKVLSRFMVVGAGFLSSDNADCNIEYINNTIVIDGKYTDEYYKNIAMILNILKKFLKEKKSIFVHIKKTNIGADLHYAGGVPNELYDINKIIDGQLKGIENVTVVGGSTFSYLPPESPTLSYIANSYRIGKNMTRSSNNE
ncbi:hypothetical protein [Sulfurimonas sp.]|uniref:hypothetical protein n=1 Tax=Sulfurimonas sp. TaxID=2022749 RepID=UPI002B4704BA|nr:hypothetical protein [Sulfurimonas sp.]